jgi:hypothetical protein
MGNGRMLMIVGKIAQQFGRTCGWVVGALVFVLSTQSPLGAQTWTWTSEKVDTEAKFSSLAVDSQGNLHVSYTDSGGHVVKYAFRPAQSPRWFTLEIDRNLQNVATYLALDSQGNPHMCYADRPTVKYASWDGKRWVIQEIAPGGTKEYTCSLVISPDGTPYVTWYQTHADDGSIYFHLRSALLRDGAWLARTVDFEGEAGKWTSMALDNKAQPFISYSIYPSGELRLAHWNGTQWEISSIDSLAGDASKANRGMGNSLKMDSQGKLHVSYYSEKELRYAVLEGDRWVIQKVTDVSPRGSWVSFLSSLDFDHEGNPHISFDDAGALKHAFWDGKVWHIQIIAMSGSDFYRYSSLAVGPDDSIYISYRDPQEGSLKVAVGHLSVLSSPAVPAAHSKRE